MTETLASEPVFSYPVDMNRKSGAIAGLYIHIPFCQRKCLYCDFYSRIARHGEIAAFLDALAVESSLRVDTAYGQFHYDTVFLGGGTPSILSPLQIESLMRILRASFDISTEAEITVECNPSSLTEELLQSYKTLGINRISLGVQSFNDHLLDTLGRLHTSKEATDSIKRIHEVNFDNLSLDLIYGIPGQTLFDWIEDLKTAAKFAPSHISAYNLIIEPETPFGKLHARGKLKLPSEELQNMMYGALVKNLGETGFERYEISNFARSTYKCRHNLKYWRLEPFLGLGPGAVSFDGSTRIKNSPDLDSYIGAARILELPPGEIEEITEGKLREETIMMSLRLAEGLSCDDFRKRFDYDILKEREKIIESLLSRGYISIDNGFLRLTPEAMFISDEIIVKLI